MTERGRESNREGEGGREIEGREGAERKERQRETDRHTDGQTPKQCKPINSILKIH